MPARLSLCLASTIHVYRFQQVLRLANMKLSFTIWPIFVLIFQVVPVVGQETAQNGLPQTSATWQDSLAAAGDMLQNGTDAHQRRQASNDIHTILHRVLTEEGSWNLSFDMIPQISVLSPEDKSFRIFSWQLYLDPDHYQHKGFVQWKRDASRPQVLQDRSDEYLRPELVIGSAANWYGAVYYGIRECKLNRKPYWLLFGFDGHSATSQRKIIEVLTLSEEGDLVFGAPVFHYDDDVRPREPINRLVMDYAIGSRVRVRYDEHFNMILYDHLMPFADERSGLGLVNIPDGTYEGFTYKKGLWQHVEKVFHKVMDEAPVDFPVLDGRKKKDIFGQ